MSDMAEILAKLEQIRSEQAKIGEIIVEAIVRTGPSSSDRENLIFVSRMNTLFDRLPKP